MTPSPFELHQYVIYERPRDHPQSFVVRRWIIGEGTLTAGPLLGCFLNLAEARDAIPDGFVRLSRSDNDDPCIVEVWT